MSGKISHKISKVCLPMVDWLRLKVPPGNHFFLSVWLTDSSRLSGDTGGGDAVSEYLSAHPE
jgi:hypothetical protein